MFSNKIIKKTILYTVTVAFFGILIFIFITRPTILNIKKTDKGIGMERAAIDNKYANRRNIKNIIADVKQFSHDIIFLNQEITLNTGEEVSFVSELEKIADKFSLIQSVSMPQSAKKNNEQQGITISLSGDYIDILRYIDTLERSSFYLIIDDINISSTKSKNSNTASAKDIKANIYGHIYFN